MCSVAPRVIDKDTPAFPKEFDQDRPLTGQHSAGFTLGARFIVVLGV